MRSRVALLAGVALVLGAGLFRPAGAGAQERPAVGLLVTTEWLAQHHADPGVRVLDVRSAEAYGAGHVPGAVRFDHNLLRNTADLETYLPAPDSFVPLLQKAGVGPSTQVVLYDDRGGLFAARLWYVLLAYGHERVSLVDGGWNKWSAEGRPVGRETLEPAATPYAPRPTNRLGCPTQAVLQRAADVVMLDARSPTEYQAGRFPKAIHVEWSRNVGGPHLTFRPVEELKRLYADLGITPDRTVITYCAVGIRASHALFTLKLLGYAKVQVYFGSWQDYSRRPDVAIEKKP